MKNIDENGQDSMERLLLNVQTVSRSERHPRRDTARAASAAGAVVVLGGLALAGCGTDGTNIGSGGPLVIQPQPIPDADFAAHFVTGSIATKVDGGAVVLSGTVDPGAAPGVDAGSLRVAAFDMTSGSAIVTSATDAAQSFAISLPGATLGDALFLYFPDDQTLGTAYEIESGATAGVTAMCVEADGLAELDLPSTAVGTSTSFVLDLGAGCGGALTVDRIATFGASGITLPATPFTIPVSGTVRETFAVTPGSTTGPYALTIVVLGSGAARHAFGLRFHD